MIRYRTFFFLLVTSEVSHVKTKIPLPHSYVYGHFDSVIWGKEVEHLSPFQIRFHSITCFSTTQLTNKHDKTKWPSPPIPWDRKIQNKINLSGYSPLRPWGRSCTRPCWACRPPPGSWHTSGRRRAACASQTDLGRCTCGRVNHLKGNSSRKTLIFTGKEGVLFFPLH